MKTFSASSSPLLATISRLLGELGFLWAVADACPLIEDATRIAWDNLLKEWLDDSSLPLLIRLSSLARGSVVVNTSGREIVPTDNSPAQWTCSLATSGKVPTLSEIRERFAADKIPVAFAHKKAEEGQQKYHCILGKHSVNAAGWKLCHIKRVGLNTSLHVKDQDINTLKRAFFDFLSPSNYFLLPKRWGGLGETGEFLEGYLKGRDQNNATVGIAGAEKHDPNLPSSQAQGDFGCQPGACPHGCVVKYKYSRICFKRGIIEPLDLDAKFCIETKKHGTFVMSKRRFQEAFPSILKSKSWKQKGLYHSNPPPPQAEQFRIDCNGPIVSQDE